MKQLETLVAKKVTSPEAVKGGRFALAQFLEAEDQMTTENCPTWSGQHYVTDCRQDPK